MDTPNIVQCQRCQAYGHSKPYCTKPYQCVKCGGQHDSKDCTKPRHNPARCALCGEDHPANYKGCNVYRNLVATRSNQTRANNLYLQNPAISPNQQRPFTIPPTSNKQPLHPNSPNPNIPIQNGQHIRTDNKTQSDPYLRTIHTRRTTGNILKRL